MSYYRQHRRFNPTKYWGTKPVCAICKNRKVVSGNICKECQEAGGWGSKTISTEQIQEANKNNFPTTVTVAPIERQEASPLMKSVVGYLKDCATAILRNSTLVDITNTKDVYFLQAPENILELLENNNLEIPGKEAFDLLYKMTSRPNEFELILGILFFIGKSPKSTKDKPKKVYSPLLYVKLEPSRSEDGQSVVFSLKEDTVFLNQAVISQLVEVKDEGELEVRFQDLYGTIPSWPLNLESLNQFLINLSNYFPEIFKEDNPVIDSFIRADEIEVPQNGIGLFPTNLLILSPKQEADGTVIEELNKMLQKLFDQTSADTIICEGGIAPTSPQTGEQPTTSEVFGNEITEDDWHNLWPIDLSDTQKKIVRSARKHALTVVSGPPGTGKSYTIVGVIIDHLLAGKKVLFVSRMDKAVEVIVNQLEQQVGPFAVARSGTRNAQRKLADKLELLTGPNNGVRPVNQKEVEALEHKYSELQDTVKSLENEFLDKVSTERDWGNVHEHIEEINEKIRLNRDLQEILIKDKKIAKLHNKVEGAQALLDNKKFFLLTWWGQRSLNKVRSILNVKPNTNTEELLAIIEKLQNQNLEREIDQELSKFAEVNQLWSEIQEYKDNLRNISKEILTRVLLGNLSLVVNNHYKRIEITTLKQALRAADMRKKHALREKVSTETMLSAFPCWASTTNHLSQILALEPGMFDLVIFDEASQCDLASAIPALYRASRAMIVGDPKQLNHVVFLGRQSEYAAYANNSVPTEAQSTYRFTTRSLFDVAEDKVEQQNYYMLDEHFRSDPHIISFSNEKFYEGKIRIMTERPVNGNGTAIKVDYVHGKRTEGTVNPKEIEAVFKHVQEIITFSDKEKPITIGILCPFRDQVDAITKALPQHLSINEVEDHKIVIGTAHSLQGDEKDVIILSLSIDPGFHHGTLMFLEKPNVFNVAITRAKKKLYVISSVEISDLPNGLLKEFLIHAESSMEETIPLDKFDSKFEQEVANYLKHNGLSVWPQYESAGFHIDLVVGDGQNYIAIECDGPTHFDLEERQNYYDVWRQSILERAGWRFVRISYREWERSREEILNRVLAKLTSLN